MKLSVIFCCIFLAINDGTLMEAAEVGDLNWWKHAVFYQIYPRSFKDDSNDGIGDLAGIISKFSHFPNSTVTCVWLSPIFESPKADLGYDISNYTKVDPDYGTNEDLKALVEKAHALGVKIILDFVPNHTSNQHQWFINSNSNVTEYRDYYVWANAKVDENGTRSPPNNWISNFKNSAWTWSEERQQYYLHQFMPQQPDLNYRNPKVLEEMTNTMKFWLDFGVDGFRVDAVPYLFEDEQLRDEPLSNSTGYNSTDYEYLDHIYTKDLPGTYDVIYHFREFVDNYTQEHGGDQRVMITEAYTTAENTMLYYGTANGSRLGAHFTFNFRLITELSETSTAQNISDSLNDYLNILPDIYTPNWVLGNHDNHRVATRFSPADVDGLNMLTAMLPGVAVTYNGEEIGQEDGNVTYEQGQDPSARDPAVFESASRDFERTPYQWDDTVNAGFNEGATPWLPVSDKYLETNLKKEQTDSGTTHYKVYQALTSLRNTSDILRNGTVEIEAIDDIILIKRTLNNSSLALVYNFSDENEIVDLQSYISSGNQVLITNVNSTRSIGDTVDPGNATLQARESLILEF